MRERVCHMLHEEQQRRRRRQRATQMLRRSSRALRARQRTSGCGLFRAARRSQSRGTTASSTTRSWGAGAPSAAVFITSRGALTRAAARAAAARARATAVEVVASARREVAGGGGRGWHRDVVQWKEEGKRRCVRIVRRKGKCRDVTRSLLASPRRTSEKASLLLTCTLARAPSSPTTHTRTYTAGSDLMMMKNVRIPVPNRV